jgi:hypothetical protein
MALPTGIEPLDTFRRGDTPTTHDRVKSYELWNYADRVMNGILMIKEVWRRSCGVWGWRVRTGSCYADSADRSSCSLGAETPERVLPPMLIRAMSLYYGVLITTYYSTLLIDAYCSLEYQVD